MTTLPTFVADSYKRYKADTNHATSWLVETAQKHGHPLQGRPLPPRSGSNRLKRKERKKAREAQLKTGGDAVATVPYSITVRELTDLADWIYKLKPPVQVPRLILSRIRRAITLRQRCATWHQQNGAEEIMVDNSSHSYFIDALIRVLQILEPNSAFEGANSTQDHIHAQKGDLPGKSETGLDILTNMYDLLTIEEDEFDELTSTTAITIAPQNVSSPQTSQSTSSRKIYQVDTAANDATFAVFYFFNDLTKLRQYLSSLWLRYKEGSLDLITVSVTTNTAIDLVRVLAQNFAVEGDPDSVVRKFIDMINGKGLTRVKVGVICQINPAGT